MSGRGAARLGIIVGFLGWMIGWVIVCLSAGRGAVLAATLPVGVAASLGLALFTILLQESVERAYGRGPTTTLALLGALAVDIGLLWLLANHWLAPSIAADAGLQEVADRLNGVFRTSDVFPGVLLACGCLVLAAAVFSAQRLGPSRGGPAPASS